MDREEFLNRLYIAFNDAHGSLNRFWDILNGMDAAKFKITELETTRDAFLFVNKRDGKYGAFKSYVLRFERTLQDGTTEKSDFAAVFKTAKTPEFTGPLKIKSYALDAEAKKIYIYKFYFGKNDYTNTTKTPAKHFVKSEDLEELNDIQLPF